jgi:2-polyprenyl-3-methyl-5-hydroxy-6-metoxy-1,4-benzoquinol methylase
MIECPLCLSSATKIIEEVDPDELVRQYQNLSGINVKYLFGKDLNFSECTCCNLRFFDPQVTGDEKFYNSLQKFDWYYVDDKYEYEIAKKYINYGDVVLDVGCGKGRFSKYVKEANGKYLGLEFSTNAKAMANNDGVDVKNLSIQDFAKQNPESVDVVASFQVCEHVPNVKEFIEAKLNALKKGGRLIIAVPSEESYLSELSNGILNMPPHHVTRWTDQVFYYLSNKYDLQLENIIHEKIQDYHARMYLSILFQNTLLKPKLLDGTLKRRIVTKISHIFSRLMVGGLSKNMRSNGHTVIAIFRKN